MMVAGVDHKYQRKGKIFGTPRIESSHALQQQLPNDNIHNAKEKTNKQTNGHIRIETHAHLHSFIEMIIVIDDSRSH